MQGEVAQNIIQSRLSIKEYLTNLYKFCIDWYEVIFFEHFGENRVVPLHMVAQMIVH